MDDIERRQWRLDGARFLIRAELAVGIAAPLIAAFYSVASPGFMGDGPVWGSTFPGLPLLIALAPWAGVVGVAIGIVWMVRLSRPDPEPGERSWRYRDF